MVYSAVPPFLTKAGFIEYAILTKNRRNTMNFIAKTFDELSAREVYEICRSRTDVFVVEQEIICPEIDGLDYDCLHCFLWSEGRVVAYLRAFYYKEYIKIGRVLTTTHGKGLGRELMEKSLEVIPKKLGQRDYILHAQTYAEGYYKKFGFETCSDVFMEDGIPHVKMIRKG